MIPAGCGDLESAGARLAGHQSGASLSSPQALEKHAFQVKPAPFQMGQLLR
jgi:hypothetical protein